MKLITLLQNQMMPLFCKIMVNGKIVSLKIFHFWWILSRFKGFPGSSDGQESVHNTEDLSLISGSARSPREGMQLTPVFLPGEIHGQRSLVGYSPWDRRVRHHWATNTIIAAEQLYQKDKKFKKKKKEKFGKDVEKREHCC